MWAYEYNCLAMKHEAEGRMPMRERIEQLAAGTVYTKLPDIKFSPEIIEQNVIAETKSTVQLTVKSCNNVNFKGFLYSSNSRVRVCKSSAAGRKETFDLEINTTGISEGNIIAGELCLVSNAGEKYVNFRFTVIASSVGVPMPNTLEDFEKLSKENWPQALRLFSSDSFLRLPFMAADPKRSAVCAALLESGKEAAALEAFLSSECSKESVGIEIEDRELKLNANDIHSEISILAEMKSWGYMRGEISSDVRWITPEKTWFSMRDFSDSKAEFKFTVDTSSLHSGINFATISFSDFKSSEKVHVEIYKESASGQKADIKRKRMLAHIFRLCLAYINQNYEQTIILAQLEESLDEYLKKYPTSIQVHLCRAWLYYIQGRIEEASSVLNWCLPAIADDVDNKKEEYCVIRYLLACISRDGKVISQAQNTIREAFEYNNGLILALLELYLVEEVNDSEKLARLKALHAVYGNSALICALAASVMRRSPESVRTVDSFEMHVMVYMLKYRCHTSAVTERYLKLAIDCYENSRLLLSVLMQLYAEYRDKRVLTMICAMLIRQGRTTPAYLGWFEQGIRDGVQIYGINDAYMTAAMPTLSSVELPREILLYYSYHNELESSVRLSLYTYIIDNFKRESDIYRAYEEQMQEFAIRKLLDGCINAQLAPLYDNLLSPAMVDEHLAGVLPDLLFSRQVRTSLSYARTVIVHYAQLKREFSEKLTGGEACIPVFTEDAAILFEDAKGNRFIDPEMTCIQLMRRPDLVQICKNIAPKQLMLQIEETDRLYACGIDSQHIMRVSRRLQSAPETSQGFKRLLTDRIIEYSCRNVQPDSRDFDQWMMGISLGQLKKRQRDQLIELYISRGFMMEAFEAVRLYGFDGLKISSLLKLAVRCIPEIVYEKDDVLLNICSVLIAENQINDIVLTYMSMYFNGTNAQMYTVLIAARNAKAQYSDIAERTIAQFMFTGCRENLEEAYRIYTESGQADESIRSAYLVLCCHYYLMEDAELPEGVDTDVEAVLTQNTERAPRVFELAMLLYYSRHDSMSPDRKKLCELLLYGFCAQNIYMECYHRLGRQVELAHQMEGRVVVQCQAKPFCKVWAEGELKPQRRTVRYDLKEIYPGLYSTAVFFFPDESVSLNLWLQDKDTEPVSISVKNLNAERCYCRRGSIYADIERLIMLRNSGQYRRFRSESEKNIRRKAVTGELLKIM